MRLICWLFACLLSPTVGSQSTDDQGVDYSWPMHHDRSSRLSTYRLYMNGCYERYNMDECLDSENDRLAMNLKQPAAQTNFTFAGYAKVEAPAMIQRLQQVWKDFNTTAVMHREVWNAGDVHTNHWKSPTSLLRLDDPDYSVMSGADRQLLVDQVQTVAEQWSQTELRPTSLYGMRVYHDGSILAPHVDRLPLVISAIINVAQSVREPWPLQLIDHNGRAHNVTLEPGQMLLYESASVIHGRPYALRGDYYASVFVHYEPVGYTAAMRRRLQRQPKSAKDLFDETLQADQEGELTRDHGRLLPHYILPGSHEAKMWYQEYQFVREPRQQVQKPKIQGVTSAHVVAANGNLQQLLTIEKDHPESLFRADGNGWTPLHEAARGGRTEIVEYLIKKGADVNERTNHGKGANALWWANHRYPDDHPVVQLLRRHGAVAIGPNE